MSLGDCDRNIKVEDDILDIKNLDKNPIFIISSYRNNDILENNQLLNT